MKKKYIMRNTLHIWLLDILNQLLMLFSLCNWIFFLLSAHTECKLSRPGPPATIVTIDEESSNGMYQPVTCLPPLLQHSTCPIAPAFVSWSAPLGLFVFHSERFGSAEDINTSTAVIVYHSWRNQVLLSCRHHCYMVYQTLWFDGFDLIIIGR